MLGCVSPMSMGFTLEVYGPAVICAWKPEWDDLPEEEKAQIKARQGVAYELQEDSLILNPDTGAAMFKR